jgi:hypothetical protein
VLWIRIRMDLLWFWQAGSGSRRAKMTHKKRKNAEISCFEALGDLFWRAGSFYWRLGLGLGINEFNFSFKNENFSCKILHFFTKTLDPDLDPPWPKMPDPHWNQCGSTTLNCTYILGHLLCLGCYFYSVVDPDPGSGAFLTPGSGIRNRFFPDTGSRIPDPKPIFWEFSDNFLGKKFYNSLKIGPNFSQHLKTKIICYCVKFVAT